MFKNKAGLTKRTHTKHPELLCNRQSYHQAAPTGRVGPANPEPRADHEHWDFDVPNPDDEFENPDGFAPACNHQDFDGPNPNAEVEHQNGLKCDAEGNFIDQNVPPQPQTDAPPNDWTPYENRNQTSAKQIDTLLDLWAATLIKHGDAPLFTSHRDLYDTIDATPLGDVPWETFSMSYTGTKPLHDIPPWMNATYDVWFCNPHLLLHGLLRNPDFDREMEYVPYQDYTLEDKRCFKNFFSGNWASNQAVRAYTISQNKETHGSNFMLLIIGSNKTTVLVATGHTEYHPLYMSVGNIFNTTKEHAGDTDYRNFRWQMFHCSLARIFKAIKPYMNTPDIVCFPDSHFRRVIYELGPYIADYPEQVLLSGVVQGWCPKELLAEELEYGKLWEEYGIVGDLMLISPDILHQIIKGAFKDHLVDWVESYLKNTLSTLHGMQVMDDIDNRIAVIAPFAGLQQFPEGHGFKQWTGDDSKALMKVYLPAIRGHVPEDVVRTFSAFLDFCYIVQHDTLTEDNLLQLQDTLDQFHQYQEIFKTTGVMLSFSLPWQHSLNHYSLLIQLFGAPNGLCSSITESKHVKAVKEPWRRSSQYKALGQMLLTNQHLDKLVATRTDFQAHGMFRGSCHIDSDDNDNNQVPVLKDRSGYLNVNEPKHRSAEGEVGETVDGPTVEAHVELAATPHENVRALSDELELPNFPQMIQQFLHDQVHAANPDPPVFDPTTALLFLWKVSNFNSTAASFYAPSDLSSTGGMRHEHIWAVPSWCGGAPRHDCVIVNMNTGTDLMNGLPVARVLCFFSFNNRTSFFQCAVVHWFSHVLEERDPDTGMYVVSPSTLDAVGTPDISIIHIDCIFHAAHLIPVYGSNFLPHAIATHDSYNVFRSYFINKYADHHAFEITCMASPLMHPLAPPLLYLHLPNSCEEISSVVLLKMKETAESYLSYTFSNATPCTICTFVISTPPPTLC
ncbi:uncharacterized protein EDB91DRAFT_1237140 [Suillus paluster]|uniref:uncharacterized protein n=1 Tax=Suillus paluster TaxID=48578 RepID=UPI001B87A18E|nr:uncharacterized protein EDB91DRAFT_1237140 [Suillus paluster]KAG1741478.1 hypothetical protein EDB91DRAFT_1237140 [Suillus paluster]